MSMIKGIAHWAMILGKPRPGYAPTDSPLWSIDVEVDENAKAKLRADGVESPVVKNSKDGTYEYIKFKRNSVKKDGEPAKPIRVVDAKGQPWDDKVLIGNGSVINVKYVAQDRPKFGGGTATTASILAVQVVKLEPYEGKGEDNEFPSYDESGKEEVWA